MADFTTRVWAGERIYMVDFGRAKTGSPHMNFPDIDTGGFQDDANASEHGYVVSSVKGLRNVRVKFYRTEIAAGTRLHIVSSNNAVAKITRPADGILAISREQVVMFDAVNSGRAVLEVRYNWPDGPVIGRLYVQVYQKLNIPLRLHLVTVNTAGNPANFFGQFCPSKADKVARLRWFIRQVNHTWISHGINLAPEATVFDSVWTNAHIGSNSQSPNYNELYMGGALSPNRSAASVNVYVLGRWSLGGPVAYGVPVAWAKQQSLRFPAAPAPGVVQHLSNAVYLLSSPDPAGHALEPLAVAHEIGHYMELCSLVTTGANAGQVQQWHSTGDTVGGPPGVRDDLITRRRLMYPFTSLQQPPSFPWRNNTGYGTGKAGGFLTHRRLTQDITTEESTRARRAAVGANFFAV